MTERTPIAARAEHDNEVFALRVGSQIRKTGEYVRKPRVGTVEVRAFETQGATVTGLVPSENVALTDGRGGWHTRAQFDKMTVTEWDEPEATDK